MNHQVSTRTDIVYRRTSKGQAAAMPSSTPTLDDEHRRLLLLVNGFTSLGVLARAGRFSGGPESLAQDLQSSGLIEESHDIRHPAFMRAPWREPPTQ